MKTKKRIFLLAFSALIFGNVHTLNAQVTIGSELEPNAGSLLDLKQDDTSPGANSTKGFNLPRVALTSLSSLNPCATDNDANKKSHTGLTVYNTTSNDDFIPGTYVWNGSSWITSSNRPKRVNANFTDLGVTQLTNGINTNIASFVIPESGYYAINFYIRCLRASAVDGFYFSYIIGDNYTRAVGIAYATDTTPVGWGIRTYGTYVNYFEVGTHYITLHSTGASWTHDSNSVSLVKLSD